MQKDFTFSVAFNEAFELFKKTFGWGLLYSVIFFLLSYLGSEISNRLIFDTSSFQLKLHESLQGETDIYAIVEEIKDFYLDLINETGFQLSIIVSVLISIILFPLSVGYLHMNYKTDTQGTSSFEDMLIGYKGGLFFKLMGLVVVYTIIKSIAMVLFFIPYIYFATAFSIAAPLMLYQNLGIGASLNKSMQLVNQKWWTTFLLLVVALLFSAAGFLLCCIGIVFTYAFIHVMVYVIYKNLTDLNGTATVESTD